MDLNEIKKIVPDNGERYIFIENGKPVLVLLSFEDYQKRFNSREEKETEREKALPLRLERTPSFAKASVERRGISPKARAPSEGKPQVANDLTLEDLPF